MADFDKYAPILKAWEGGYAVVPGDAGGATNMGVTLTTFQMHYGQDKTIIDLQRMTDQQWRAIMKGDFWDKCWGDMIRDQSVAESIVDWCINSGTGMLKKVQGMVGTKADGVMGPKTLSAINSADQRKLHYRIKAARLAHLSDISTKGSNLKFFDGWINRVAALCYGKSMRRP